MTGLFGSSILEVAIGMTFVYLLLAVCCTTVNEWISGLFKVRSKLLLKGITQLLAQGDEARAAKVVTAFYGHPLIRGMTQDGKHPSYLSARAFAIAVMDLATPSYSGAITFENLMAGIKDELPDSGFRTALLALLQNTDGTVQGAQLKIEGWYDDAMDRVSGWYKRRTQVWTFVVAAILTIACNADSINIAESLWIGPALRSTVVAFAQNDSQTKGRIDSKEINTAVAHLLGQVIGWQHINTADDVSSWAERAFGWILTIIAVSLGAPFWFDTLRRIVNLRSTGRSPIEFGPPPQKPSLPIINP